MRNVLNIDNELQIVFEHALCANDDGRGNIRRLEDFVDDYGVVDFASYFVRFMESHDNVIIYSRDRAHYVTLLKKDESYILVDALRLFRFIEYSQISVLTTDLSSFVGSAGFSLHSARVFGLNPLGE
jgi:hypothetical protein